MEGPKTPNQIVAVDGNDFAARKATADKIAGFGVAARLPELGHEYGSIDDEKIRIARRHALPAEGHRPRHRQFDDRKFSARWRAKPAQALEIVGQQTMVRIAPVGLNAGEEAVPLVESRDVVDMAVRIVADDPLAHPQYFVHAEVILQVLFDLRLGQVRVAIRIQEALLAGEQKSLAVHIDRAAFENHGVRESAQAQLARDETGYPVVEIVGPVLVAPHVEHPVGNRDLTGAAVLH